MDDQFIIKTVQHKEAEFLQKLLPGYYLVGHQSFYRAMDISYVRYVVLGTLDSLRLRNLVRLQGFSVEHGIHKFDLCVVLKMRYAKEHTIIGWASYSHTRFVALELTFTNTALADGVDGRGYISP